MRRAEHAEESVRLCDGAPSSQLAPARLRNPLQVNLNTVTCMTMPCCIRLSLSLSPLSLSLSLWILLERMYVWSAVYSDALVCIRFPCGRITIIRCPIRSGSAAGHCPAPRPTAGHTAATRTARTAARRRCAFWCAHVRARAAAGASLVTVGPWGRTARKIEAEPVRERVFGDGKTGRGVRACNVPFGYRANLVFPKVFPVFR